MSVTDGPESTALSLNQRRIHSSRLEIATKALEIVASDGWDSLEVPQLAAAAGLSTRTFYRYFPRKRDIFRPLLADAGIRSREHFDQPRGREFAALCADALVAGVLAFPGGPTGAHNAYRILLSTPELTPVWLDESLAFETALRPHLPQGFIDRLAPQFPPSGSRGGPAGRSNRPDINPRHLGAAVVFASMRIAIQTWVSGSDPGSLHELAEQSVALAVPAH